MKKTLLLFASLLIVLAIAGCSLDTTAGVFTGTPTYDDEDDEDVVTTVAGSSDITFTTTAVTITTANGTASTTLPAGSTISIDAGGVYVITGAGEGNIVVSAGKDETVTLVLSGCDLTSPDGPVILAEQSGKLILNLADGTANRLADRAGSTSDIHSVVFSNDDVTINGTGSLTIEANVGNGLNTDDDLVITNGTIAITAENNCLKANDSITIKDATLTLTAGNDAIHCENAESAENGLITIESGVFTISAYGDGLDASHAVTIFDGTFMIVSGVNNASIATVSGKGIKATDAVAIAGGTIDIVSKDDAIHANGTVVVAGGSIAITSNDDGIHADETLSIEGGEIDIRKSYEGLESLAIAVSGGTVRIKASDDGINGAGGVDGSGTFPWGGQPRASAGNASLSISGGYVYVDSTGDGLDVNGALSISGGVVIVNGPTASDNGALDYDSSFAMTGGILIAAGSMGMAQNVGSTSTQYGVLVNLTTASAKIVRIETADGTEVVTFRPSKNIQTIVICTPEFARGTTYNVYLGGTVTDPTSSLDGVTAGGTYASGTLYKTFTITAIATTVGTSSGGGRP
ncbi:MAG: carbohydrate-binding domain-containing protein [Candidatus Izemoplasmatales bacterium]